MGCYSVQGVENMAKAGVYVSADGNWKVESILGWESNGVCLGVYIVHSSEPT